MASIIEGAVTPAVQQIIKESKILLVGSGGIGCEVLKNLVMLGFSGLEIIDSDTVEASNLNHQFFFQKESVGKPKSIMASKSALKFNKKVIITAHVGDITDQFYGIAFYRKFNLIISALDNRKARAHVNRMCLLCGIPLVDFGTAGYNGEIEIILKGKTPCYESVPKLIPKTYPICTIRNTPKKPIHCIVWAQFLFDELFGKTEENALYLNQNNCCPTHGYTEMSTRYWAIINNYDNEELLEKIFFDDIIFMTDDVPHLYLCEDKSIKPPVSLDRTFLKRRSNYKEVSDEETMDIHQNITMFLDSVVSIHTRLLNSNNQPLIWNKDDDDFMNFVAASTNIRAVTFNIPMLSRSDIKTMAGNIIPAIATTNAIIAGQISKLALRILKGEIDRTRTVYLRSKPNRKRGLLVKDKKLQVPNKKCNVCSEDGQDTCCRFRRVDLDSE